MDQETILATIERAKKVVDQWPWWKRNIVKYSGEAFLPEPRQPVENFREKEPMELERRYGKNLGVELRKRENAPPMIVGYASVFYREGDKGTEYELWPGVVERIMPGAFDRAIREDDVRALFNHDINQVLGRTVSGTLRLSVDATGLRYEIDPPDTQVARELLTLIERGDITGSSFGFIPDDTSYRDVGQVTYIERNAVKLFDVSPVTFPAYEAATTGLRSATNAQAELDAWREVRKKQQQSVARDAALARARVVSL